MIKNKPAANRFLDEFGFSNPLATMQKTWGNEKMKREFINIENKLVKFDKIGMAVEGEYKGKKAAGNFGNDAYELKTDSGVQLVFSSAVMARKMMNVEPGTYVRITYVGDIPNVKKGQNPIKDFKVEVATN